MILSTRFQIRQGSSAEWAAANPVLLEGEPGFDTDTNEYKIGDGTSRWSALKTYVDETKVRELINVELSNADPSNSLAAHISDPTPHPAYDDGPSFLLLYQNAKV